MAHFGVYLTNQNNKSIEIPVSPNEIMLSLARLSDTVEIINIGEVNRAKGKGLLEITISSSFPIDRDNTHYTTASTILGGASFYLDFIKNWFESKKFGMLTVSTTGINIRMTVDKFEYGFKNGNMDEYVYTLVLKEWRALALRVKNLPIPPPPKPKPAPAGKIGIGSAVIVNGQLFRDSYGTGGGLTELNATRKVNFLALGRAKPYHVTDMSGGWRGWVSAESVRLA
ncbi:hypothetical protein GTP07_07110 [Lactococcus lactis]|uniref:hypothetical protein n=1 Tax=Lactococcus lactis TaxID=1358 RepID=UPI0013C99F48|nr:hypothetical protein [Lactococcus lactis]NEX52792.1 hypothetical protein [Lactococcus lactis]